MVVPDPIISSPSPCSSNNNFQSDPAPPAAPDPVSDPASATRSLESPRAYRITFRRRPLGLALGPWSGRAVLSRIDASLETFLELSFVAHYGATARQDDDGPPGQVPSAGDYLVAVGGRRVPLGAPLREIAGRIAGAGLPLELVFAGDAGSRQLYVGGRRAAAGGPRPEAVPSAARPEPPSLDPTVEFLPAAVSGGRPTWGHPMGGGPAAPPAPVSAPTAARPLSVSQPNLGRTPGERGRSCFKIRNEISRLLSSGEMSLAAFLARIGSDRASYDRFMALRGVWNGTHHGVYPAVSAFFEAREEEAAKDPAANASIKSKADAIKRNADAILERLEAAESTPYVEGPIYDSFRQLREKVDAFIEKEGISAAALCRMLGLGQKVYAEWLYANGVRIERAKTLPPRREGQGGQHFGFLWGAYHFFERLRLAEGRPKSKDRVENERSGGYVEGPIYDSIPQLREKVDTFIAKEDISAAAFCRMLGLSSKEYARWKFDIGVRREGAKEFVPGHRRERFDFVWVTYHFFERRRLAEGQPKSKERVENEQRRGRKGGEKCAEGPEVLDERAPHLAEDREQENSPCAYKKARWAPSDSSASAAEGSVPNEPAKVCLPEFN